MNQSTRFLKFAILYLSITFQINQQLNMRPAELQLWPGYPENTRETNKHARSFVTKQV